METECNSPGNSFASHKLAKDKLNTTFSSKTEPLTFLTFRSTSLTSFHIITLRILLDCRAAAPAFNFKISAFKTQGNQNMNEKHNPALRSQHEM